MKETAFDALGRFAIESWAFDMARYFRVSREGDTIKLESKKGKDPLNLAPVKLTAPDGYFISEVSNYFIKFSPNA